MRYCYLFIVFCIAQTALCQPPQQPSASQIRLKLKRLNFLGSVLYVAAHPDDENTRVITALSNGKLATTAYLSMTRGDGGQNLIGPEIRDLLGVIRTQELLAARRIDGGRQFFTRANDFGFSKSADEAFNIWGKDEILSDVVKVIRQYQPDVIITRFPPDERAGHGHHTASAILAQEAFDVAAKEDYRPDLSEEFGPWQARRLYTNTGRWWNKDINENTPGVIYMDVGGYNALLGKSYAEISALSSSQHKSQGWGRAGDRGRLLEFFEYVKGEKAQKDFFEGVNTSWSRVKGGEKIQVLVDRLNKDYNEEQPSAIVPQLLITRNAVQSLENSVWKKRKLEELNQLIIDCLGLYVEATSTSPQGSPGEETKAVIEVVSRSPVPVALKDIRGHAIKWDTAMSLPLAADQKMQIKLQGKIDGDASYTEPYWLREKHDVGRFVVKDPMMIGAPENAPAVTFDVSLEINGAALNISRPLIYKWVDPVKGELWRPFEILPTLVLNTDSKVMIFADENSRSVQVKIASTVDRKISGSLRLQVPEGWKFQPANFEFELDHTGQELVRSFTVTPPANESSGSIVILAEAENKLFHEGLRLIEYDHIPVQSILPESSVKVVHADLAKEGKLVGYIQGAGDEIPAALRNIGYEVWEMKNDEVTLENLKKADAVVLGIRALNTNARAKFFFADLLRYVEDGGTLLVQYNTNHDLEVENFSPFSIKLSRDRVTEEDCEVRILKPEHPVFNTPNKITTKDFENWVQERGLYFPNQWDSQFDALLSMNDKKEPARDGSLLVARYGKGYYVYTGLSFFRQLPEAVPGAFKLFANLVSLGAETKTQSSKPKTKSRTK